MKIAVLGGGLTGLVAGYFLQKRGHQVILYEKEKLLGGLAAGFKKNDWNWHLDNAYHHLFANDNDIINFLKEIGFKHLRFYEPETASLYKDENNYRIIPVDTPQDFLRFPFMPIFNKLRAAAVLALLKYGPFLNAYEKITAKDFLVKTMGKEGWNILWKELFRKKFGNYAENVLASFIWARINKRTKKLGYPDGGFQEMINYIENKLISMGLIIKKGNEIKDVRQTENNIIINGQKYDRVISTLPTPIFISMFSSFFPVKYKNQLKKIKYLHAINYIFETKSTTLNKTYWLSIAEESVPFMVCVQHTNLVNKKNFNGKNIIYIGRYLHNSDPVLKLSKEQIKKLWIPYLEKIIGNKIKIENDYLYKAAYAQPIFDKEFINNKPRFVTPVKNLFCANLDMTYPYDRGTNYAVKLGKTVAGLI